MARKIKIISSLLIFSALALGCSISGSQKNPEDLQPDESGLFEILFEDDFSNPKSGWDRFEDKNGQADYQDDGYRILITAENYLLWSNPGKKFDDVQIEVEARVISGPPDAEYGLICRYQNESNFYFSLVSADGYYGILKVSDGEVSFIGASRLEQNSAVSQGKEPNQIRFDCIGDTLTLYANDEYLAEAVDEEFTKGDVGLIVGSNQEAGAEVLFNNFIVYPP